MKNNLLRINIKKYLLIPFFVLIGISQASFGMINLNLLSFVLQKADLKKAESILEKYKKQINDTNDNNDTLISLACSKNNLSIAKLLLNNEAKKSINTPNRWGCTPINEACVHNNLAMVQLLLKNGAATSINIARQYNVTPLLNACEKDNIKIVQLLLDNGAQKSINVCTFCNVTPIYFACENDNIEMAKLLLSYGAQKTINTVCYPQAKSPLYFACKNNNLKLAKLLLANGAKISDKIVTATNNQEIKKYLQLILDFDASKNKFEFFKYQIECKNIQEASLLTKRIFLKSMKQTINGNRKIEATVFEKIYNFCSLDFLNNALGVSCSREFLDDASNDSCKKDLWQYAKEVIKENKFFFDKESIYKYSFQRKLLSMKKNRKYSDMKNHFENNNFLGKRKREEHLLPNKKQKLEKEKKRN